MNKKYTVSLSEQEKNKLHSMLRSGKLSKNLTKRANLLLAITDNAKNPLSPMQAANQFGVSASMVTVLAKDYVTKGFDECMTYHRNPNQNNIRKVTGEQEARIIALACGEPPAGQSQWSLRLLRNKAVELNIIEPISVETFRTTLKKTNFNLTDVNTGVSLQNKTPNL